MSIKVFKKSLLGLSVASIVISAQVEAQQMLEELVVTSRKRAETLQEIPDSITVFGRDQIESAGIQNFEDFANLTPNLSINAGYRPGQANVTVRGMITPLVGGPPIAYVIDGVTAPSVDFLNNDLFAIERIEVLRGPQGALYGKGAVGGAINIVTRQPGNEVEGQVKVSVANGGKKSINGFVSGPVIEDKLLYQLGGSYSDKDGLIKNRTLDTEVDFSERKSIQGMLKVLATDDLSIDFRAKYADTKDAAGQYAVVDFDDTNLDSSFSRNRPISNILGFSDREITEFSTKIDWYTEIGEATFVLGYSDVEDNTFSDSDYTNRPSDFVSFFAGAQETVYEVEAYTAEFRLTGDTDSFEWQVGAYYQDRTINSTVNLWDDLDGVNERVRSDFVIPQDEFNLTNLDPFFLTDYLLSIVDENSSESWAVFGQFDYDITDQLSMAFALRYDEDKRESFDHRQKSVTISSQTFSETQPKLQLTYNFTDDFMTYFSASKGFRSGGFNEPHPQIIRTFGKEVSENYEVGFKSVLMDGAMTLSGAIFNIDIENTQFTRFNQATFTLENLGIDESTSQGVELELLVQATEGLRLNFGYGYSDVEIDKFTADPALNIEGNTMPSVHRYNVNAGLEHVAVIQDGIDLVTRVDLVRKGPLQWDMSNIVSLDTSNFVNARIGIQAETYSVTLFVDNATDERVATEGIIFAAGPTRMPNQPRHYGLEANYMF